MQHVIIDFTDETQQEIAGVIGPFATVEDADHYDESTGQRGTAHLIVPMSPPESLGGCPHCRGGGVLIGDVYLNDGVDNFDADQIARHDECDLFESDVAAGRAVASQLLYGGYVVWAERFDGIPSENPNVFVRNDPTSAANLQHALLTESMTSEEFPTVMVHVEEVEKGEDIPALRNFILRG